MNTTANSSGELKRLDETLAQAFYGFNRYNPIFLAITGAGFAVIYWLTRFNLLGQPTPQLLYIAGAFGLSTLIQFPALAQARRKNGRAAFVLGAISLTVLAIALSAFWEGITLLAFLLVFFMPALALRAGMPARVSLLFGLPVILGLVSIWLFNSNPPLERLPGDSTPAITSLAFLGAASLLLFAVTVIAQSRAYRSLRNQLLVSFLIIVTIPTLLATVLSAVGAYVNNENQVFNILETISSLKENQVEQVINGFEADAQRVSADLSFTRNILRVLTAEDTTQTILQLYRSFSRNRLIDLLNSESGNYAEIMVLNTRGEAILSTDTDREGRRYSSELFYREGSIGPFTGFSKNPLFGEANLVFATPLYDQDGLTLRGILVFRANSRLIKDIVETTPSFTEMETYLLDKDYYPVTKTRTLTQTVQTEASRNLIGASTLSEGQGTYENYAGEFVLGYYKRLDVLNLAFIAEVPRSYLIENSLNSLLGSSALSIFAVALAVAAVAISANSITEPISALSKVAESFATGQLSTRARFDRRDEIGALGKTYDQMAEQLQDIIGKLEQRVSDRTKELESQTLRLRASAEIARDAASSHNLNDLLSKAGTLIQERFNLYHTGIFLLDNNREYAVLAASPTPAGKQMIAKSHKLRVGEVGIVGRVASTGAPRISLDTGTDAVHFDNPLLPDTRSEMALPLKVENRLIGVLDVQSTQSQAFDENDIAIMQILADQLATAIERTRLLQQVEENLSDLERAYGQFTSEGWRSLNDSGLLTKSGYRFDNVRIQQINDVPELGEQAMQTGTPIINASPTQSVASNKVAIPIKLRGQTIGVVAATLKDGYAPNTISTLELAIERLALSLESARLYEEARLRADREQTIAQIASSISAATEFDAILRTTVEEVGRVLGDSEVSIQILDGTEPNNK
jgi:GAF domain-containing protein/HAMP domain-containing protein